MSTTAIASKDATTDARVGQVDMKLEVITIPVSDLDRAKEFYEGLGWRLDADFNDGDRPRGPVHPSGLPVLDPLRHEPQPAAPGSAQGLFLVVSDIEAARDELVGRGVEVSEVFHFAKGPGSLRRPGRRPRAGPRQLRLVRVVQRPGRQRLAVAGGHDAVPRPGGRRHDVRRPRATWRRRSGVRRPPTASTRSAPGSATRTGPTGTPRTWWRSRPARSCRCEVRAFSALALVLRAGTSQ